MFVFFSVVFHGQVSQEVDDLSESNVTYATRLNFCGTFLTIRGNTIAFDTQNNQLLLRLMSIFL